MMGNLQVYDFTFQNLTEEQMTFITVFDHIQKFMQKNPAGSHKLMFGTDSQIHPTFTRFITGIVIQCETKGAWACIRKVVVPRKMVHLHERISYETTLTEEVVSMFTDERKEALVNIVLPHIYNGASFTIEGHIDIGAERINKTRIFVNEMVARMESLGIEAKIKPNSFVASSYANRFTK